MDDSSLFDELDGLGVIDKRIVLWWQFGFEGRRILSEEEFSGGLESRTIQVGLEQKESEVNVWTQYDVPILLQDISLAGKEVPCFVTVKPLSHDPYPFTTKQYAPSLNLFPHIRGVVYESTDQFLFWTPLLSKGTNAYETTIHNGKDYPIFSNSVEPSRFYRNLLNRSWRGKRLQRKALRFDYVKEGYSLVPYFQFDRKEKHIFVCPVPFFKAGLEIPVFVKSGDPVEVIGGGYVDYNRDYNSLRYWELPGGFGKHVRKSLEKLFS